MKTYEVVLSSKARTYIRSTNKKTQRIITSNLQKLTQPYPGRGPGDKEKIIVSGEEIYRMHISRSYTAFYVILLEERLVRMFDIMTIEAAHKKYGRY